MVEEGKPKQLVQMSTVLASGITAIVAALFTSRLGVAGTLIGTAMTPMLMTIGVAILNAQIQKATERITVLPSAVRVQRSTQRVRVPGTPSSEAPPAEPEPPVTSRRRDRRTPGLVERLLSLPAYLKEMSPSARRRTLLTGAAAGLVAAVIGLTGVTGLEIASGDPLYCSVWDRGCGSSTVGSSTPPSVVQAFKSSSNAEDQYAPPNSAAPQPGSAQQQSEKPAASNGSQQYQGEPQGGQQSPSGQTPEGSSTDPAQQQQDQQQPTADQEAPNAAPQDGSQQPPATPGAEQQPAAPLQQQQ